MTTDKDMTTPEGLAGRFSPEQLAKELLIRAHGGHEGISELELMSLLAAEELTRQEGEVERLREALKPFANLFGDLDPEDADDAVETVACWVGDLRRAHAAFASEGKLPGEPTGGNLQKMQIAPDQASPAPTAPVPTQHWSDCAVNNAPAMEPGPCDCGGYNQTAPGVEPVEGRSKIRTIQYYDGSHWVVLSSQLPTNIGWTATRQLNPDPGVYSIEEILESRRQYAEALRPTTLKDMAEALKRIKLIARATPYRPDNTLDRIIETVDATLAAHAEGGRS